MTPEEFLANPLIKNVSPIKKEILVELVNKVEGLKPNEAIQHLVPTMNKIRAMGITFSNEETSLLIEVITSNATPAEKQRYDMMIKMLNTQIKNRK